MQGNVIKGWWPRVFWWLIVNTPSCFLPQYTYSPTLSDLLYSVQCYTMLYFTRYNITLQDVASLNPPQMGWPPPGQASCSPSQVLASPINQKSPVILLLIKFSSYQWKPLPARSLPSSLSQNLDLLTPSVIYSTRSLGALQAPTSSWRSFGPLNFILRALRALRTVHRARLRLGPVKRAFFWKLGYFCEKGFFLKIWFF